MIGLVGKKIGMTRVFTKEGIVIPITVVKVNNNRVTQIKKKEKDLYNAVQVTTGKIKNNRLKKPAIGHFMKNKVLAGIGLWEFRVENIVDFKVGQILTVDIFSNINKVDITGFSKGKGFSGTIKRWNFKMQDATHGNSLSHRVPGSIGQNQTPGRVFKGKKMSGHLGNSRTTIQNLKIIEVDVNNSLLLIKGSVPGPKNSNIIVKPAIKG
ncbi:50S ribosomal protein L3 [Buchnera aphidicola]|uniref:Large ribosomal subunit protein uL3 n=1 Tax=Buchnera aphidicola (Anoecia oenotherae) TaxID=1241833 RepID=A0A4D6XR86_9GAMM|nr:50S ribosomal protein L3 [Buchnera aphidicola]QCI19523.1 50S ribosomal protein L3 [Buchnera aphidicola (Anoecia oenotherae)]